MHRNQQNPLHQELQLDAKITERCFQPMQYLFTLMHTLRKKLCFLSRKIRHNLKRKVGETKKEDTLQTGSFNGNCSNQKIRYLTLQINAERFSLVILEVFKKKSSKNNWTFQSSKLVGEIVGLFQLQRNRMNESPFLRRGSRFQHQHFRPLFLKTTPWHEKGTFLMRLTCYEPPSIV